MHAYVHARANIFQSSKALVSLRARVFSKKCAQAVVTNHVRICALVQSYKSIGVRARPHIFQFSKSIGELTRARVLLKKRART